ncbi:MAG TPA: hypothetical protein DCQ06_09885 [Myxococcales bacterium]|nr:hypothetical protein [Myxococcales bacterium]
MTNTRPANSADDWVFVHSSGLGPRQFSRTTAAIGGRAPPLSGYDGQAIDVDTWHWHQDLARVTALAGPDSVLVGHSYGGFLALQAALQQSVRAVVVWEPVVWSVLRTSHTPKQAAALTDPTLPLQTWLSAFINYWNGPMAWQSMQARHREPFERYGAKVRLEVAALLTDRTPEATWSSLRTPVLVLRGDQTIADAQTGCEALANLLPEATYEVVAGAGHMGPVTAEAEFRQRCLRWVQDL